MKIASINGELAWAIVAFYVLENRSFKSVRRIQYQARISGKTIFYKGGGRNQGEEETISYEEFENAFVTIQSIKNINTNTIKMIIPNSLYRKRTPLIGLLHSSGILI